MKRLVKHLVDSAFSLTDDFQAISMLGLETKSESNRSLYKPGLDLALLIIPDQLPQTIEGQLYAKLIVQAEQVIAQFVKNPYNPVPIFSPEMTTDPVGALSLIARFNIVVRHEILLHRLALLSCADMVKWLMLVHSLAEAIDVTDGRLELSSRQEKFLQQQDNRWRPVKH